MMQRVTLTLLVSVVAAVALLVCVATPGSFGSKQNAKAPSRASTLVESSHFRGRLLSSVTFKAMSYNTEYIGYPSRVAAYGQKINDVGAGVVGIQECMDKNALAAASGYQVVPGTDFQNPIFYNLDKVSFVDGSGGWMSIPSDLFAPRTITWAKFKVGSTEFWFFNTHLPHPHGDAASRNTHARIANMLLQKREELGAGNMPTVIVGDCNPFASDGNTEGSFESVLVAAGFEKSYQVKGNPGFPGLDKIFASSHWSSSNGADQGLGTSDHAAIAVDLTIGSLAPTPATPSTSPAPTPEPTCSAAGSDRWGPNLGGCCSALEDCVEARPEDDSYYCATTDPRHGSSCWSTVVMCRSACVPVSTTPVPTTPEPVSCSVADTDRWDPNLGGCCSALEECVEARPEDDSYYCATTDPLHGSSCWSTVVMCRGACVPVSTTPLPTTPEPVSCSVADTDRWDPNLGGCCSGLEQCAEARRADDSLYCAVNDPRHGSSCWSSIIMCRNTCTPEPEPQPESCASFGQWPNVDNGVTCGSCTALVQTAPYGGKCEAYCRSFGHQCVASAEEVNENCDVKYSVACDTEIQGTSDMLCTCHGPTDPTGSR